MEDPLLCTEQILVTACSFLSVPPLFTGDHLIEYQLLFQVLQDTSRAFWAKVEEDISSDNMANTLLKPLIALQKVGLL
jgi:hypothetical protein